MTMSDLGADPDSGVPHTQCIQPILMVPEGQVLAVFAITEVPSGDWCVSEHRYPGIGRQQRAAMPKFLRAMAEMIDLQESSDELLP